VTVAARDLPAGLAITHSDVREVRWRAGTAPSGMVRTAVGLTLGSPARRGEPITDARLTGPGMLVGQPAGSRAMAVRLTGPTAGVVHGGDRVDLLAGPSVQGDPAGEMAQADVIAEAVLVLAAPAGAIPGGAGGGAGDLVPGSVTGAGQAGPDGSGEVLVVAVDTATALRLAAVSGLRSLTVLVRGMR
ncbi:MAG: RcpC/CpaB family pilus assembly protein, partial [Kineosporiaceae bacterium]